MTRSRVCLDRRKSIVSTLRRGITVPQSHRTSSAAWLALIQFAALVAGCADGVRQDRTITVSHDGSAVAVQHDEDGIFVADSATGDIVKIYQPEADVIAASSPLWTPVDQRLIFATAVDPKRTAQATRPADNPDGRVLQE